MGTTLIIPTIPPRAHLLKTALRSAGNQTLGFDEIIIEPDVDREGPAVLRNRAAERAETEWVAFLDDDDELYPPHHEACLNRAIEDDADLVYPWFDLFRLGVPANSYDPLRLRGLSPLGQMFDTETARVIMEECNFIPVTVLVRREALLDVGGFPQPGSADWPASDCEDWGLWQRMLRNGAVFAHEPQRTWRWNHWGGNTSGLPSRW